MRGVKQTSPAASAGADDQPSPAAAVLPVRLTFVAAGRDSDSTKFAEALL
jgi:hypothetical protein